MDSKHSFLFGGVGAIEGGETKGTTDIKLIECFYSIKPTCCKVHIFNNKSIFSLAAKAEALTSFQTLVDSKKYMLRLWQIYVTSLTTPYQTSTWFGLVSEWQSRTMMWPGSSKTITIYWNIILSNVWYYHTGWKCHRDRLHYSNCCARHRADTIMQIGCYPLLQHTTFFWASQVKKLTSYSSTAHCITKR